MKFEGFPQSFTPQKLIMLLFRHPLSQNEIPVSLCSVAGTLSCGLRMAWAVSPSLLWSPLGPCQHLRHLWSLDPSPGSPSEVPECSLNKWFHNCRINSTLEGKGIWDSWDGWRQLREFKEGSKKKVFIFIITTLKCLQAQYFHLASFTFIVHYFINEGTEWKVT